jgi:folate-binding protein YgfZ
MQTGFQLGYGTVLRFLGADRCRVFNNLCTQDLRKLTSGQAMETFITDVKGRTFGHGIAFALDDEAFFLSVPDQAAKLVPHFDRYIIREDAQVIDASNEYQFWLFENRRVCALGLGIDIASVPEAGRASRVEMNGAPLMLVHAPWIGSESLVCLASPASEPNAIASRLGDLWIGSDMKFRTEWELARINAFWPWYGVDMDDRHLPQELNRDSSAISFTKGCYLGQETIARLDMLGKVQKKLVSMEIFSTQSPSLPAPVLDDGKEVGSLCSVAANPSQPSFRGLAFVKRTHFVPGQKLTIADSAAIVLGGPKA